MRLISEKQTFIPERLEYFLKKYGEVANVYVAAFNRNGEAITNFACNDADKEIIERVFSEAAQKELFLRVTEYDLEDQVIEDTAVDDIKVAASAIKREGKTQLVWMFCASILPQSEIKEERNLQQAMDNDSERNVNELSRKTTMPLFFWAMDVLRDMGTECIRAQYSMAEWKEKNKNNPSSGSEMTENLRRMELLSEILQYLNSDKSIEYIMEEFLQITAQYLNLGSAYIINRDEASDGILIQWGEENKELTRMVKKHRFSFMEGSKIKMLSFDSIEILQMLKEYGNLPFYAVMAVPIEVNKQITQYACYFETGYERIWKQDETLFIRDAVRILQNILERRIQKNSIDSSYASLKEILENIGGAVIVVNHQDEKIQFMNQKTRLMFPKDTSDSLLAQEVKERMIRETLQEFYDYKREAWYEIHKNVIRWVDGQKADMYSIFDITDKKMYQQKIEKQAYTDFLTGLFNRLCCERDLARTVDEAKKYGQTGALLYLDLDDFKHINDGLGHQYGDVLLKSISDAFRSIKGIEQTTYRMGGDEFVIIIQPNQYYRVGRIVEDIKAIFAKPWLLKDSEYYCTMSMGIVTFPDEGDSVADLIKKADIAMYEAKKSGKNRVAKFDSAKLSESNKRLDMEKNMRDATVNGYHEFEIYYQPVIDIQREGTPCTGAEALIRWNSQEMGFISPADFIPLAEYLGLINPIGNFVLVEACKACRFWNENGHPEYKVNVNLSVVQLLQNNIVDIVEDTLKETGINPRNLTLEVTESLAINDMERMKGIMHRIRQLGVRIALDDFGTGYSSLNHIREIPLDVIKVDQSFVKDLVEDEYSKSFVKMVAELADAIGVSICVEGIESYEQYKVLENMKVRIVQGYYFGRPMPREDFEIKYLSKNK